MAKKCQEVFVIISFMVVFIIPLTVITVCGLVPFTVITVRGRLLKLMPWASFCYQAAYKWWPNSRDRLV